MRYAPLLTGMETQTESISTFLADASTEIAELQTQTADLVTRIADYSESRTFGAIGLVPLTMKINGLAKDVGEVAKIIPSTLAETGVVLGKLTKVSNLPKTESSPAPSEKTIEPTSVGESAGETEHPIAPPESSVSTSQDLFNGQWNESNPNGQHAIIFWGKPVVGQPSGMMSAGARGIQASLLLMEAKEDQYIYSDPNSGNLFRVSPFDDQIILKHYKPDGTKIFQMFMERP